MRLFSPKSTIRIIVLGGHKLDRDWARDASRD